MKEDFAHYAVCYSKEGIKFPIILLTIHLTIIQCLLERNETQFRKLLESNALKKISETCISNRPDISYTVAGGSFLLLSEGYKQRESQILVKMR